MVSVQHRGRIRLRDEEEEEEEEVERRLSQRKRKRVKYKEEDDEDSDDSEQPGPSTLHTPVCNTPDIKKTLLDCPDVDTLPVTCGDKNGVLDIDKLARGEACIESAGCWFAPPAFEDFGGRHGCKKWKRTILYDDKPLLVLFEQGYLSSPGFQKRKSSSTKKKNTLNNESESSPEESGADVKDDNEKDQDWSQFGRLAAEEPLETEEQEEETGAERDGGEIEDSGDDGGDEEEDDAKREKEEGKDTDWFVIQGYKELGEKSGAKLQTRLLKIPLKRSSEARRKLFPSNRPHSPEKAEKRRRPVDKEEEDGARAVPYSEDEGGGEDGAEETSSTDASDSPTPDLPVLVSSRGVAGETLLSMPTASTQTTPPPDVKPIVRTGSVYSQQPGRTLSPLPSVNVPKDASSVLPSNANKGLYARSVVHRDDAAKADAGNGGVGETDSAVLAVESVRAQKGGQWREAEGGASEARGARGEDGPLSGDNGLLREDDIPPVARGHTEENPSARWQAARRPAMLPRVPLPRRPRPPSSSSSPPNATPSTSFRCSPPPRSPEQKNNSFTGKGNPGAARHQGRRSSSRAVARERNRERREAAVVDALRRISGTQSKIVSALERLCSRQDTVIELLQRLAEQNGRL